MNDKQDQELEALKVSAHCRAMAQRLYNEPIGSIQVTDVGALLEYAAQLLALAQQAGFKAALAAFEAKKAGA